MEATNTVQSPRRGWWLGLGLATLLALAAYALAMLPVLSVMGTLSVALLLGIAWRTFAGTPTGSQAGIKFAARPLLRAGIVLMGARLNYGLVLSVGPKILLLDLAVIVLGISGLYALTRRFGLPRDLGMLMAVGTGICGASAVAAASTVTRSDEETTTLAVALMGLLGTAGVFLYVVVGPFLGLGAEALGVLTGSTLHEVAQVIAAAFTFGPAAGDMGTLVKLTRVVLLAPALLVVGWLFRPDGEAERPGGLSFDWRNPPVPYFVLGFLALGALNSTGVLGPVLPGALTAASVFLMALAMAAMGLSTDLRLIARTGAPALAAGFLGFLGIAVMAYGLIRWLGIA